MTNTPIISVRGKENSPVHRRLASSFATNNRSDQQLVDTVNIIRGIYQGYYITNLSFSILYSGLSIFSLNPALALGAIIFGFNAHEWKKGRDWIDNSENVWNGVINCHRWETRTFTTLIRDCNTNVYFQGPSGTIIPGSCFGTAVISTPVFVRRPSDGLFCDDRQTINGASSMNIIDARGVNHSEETNTRFGQTENGNDEMDRIFNLIWNSGDVFEVVDSNLGC